MLLRFSLYGFLKNQRYFEPFLVLSLVDKGMSFFLIGLLYGFRELAVAAMEIPSGAVADVWGRKRSMILSFAAYAVSFVLFGLARDVRHLFAAMFLFAVGESFRTGTHKAMIFSWLQQEGRTGERTRVYGFTRSWSKIGSAVSVVVAAVLVFVTSDYQWVFFLSIVPYLVGIVNFLGYSPAVDGRRTAAAEHVGVGGHLGATLRRCFVERGVRRLILESMGFEGVFHAVKDYLQPILQAAAAVYLAGLVASGMTDPQQTALLIGPVYLVLYLAAAVASRNAHRLVDRCGGEDRAAWRLWQASGIVFAAMLAAGLLDVYSVLALGFVLLHVMQNLWRPVLVSRIDSQECEADGATVLSVESQGRRLATLLLAPLVGWSIDLTAHTPAVGRFWPIGLIGVAISAGFLLARKRSVGGEPKFHPSSDPKRGLGPSEAA